MLNLHVDVAIMTIQQHSLSKKCPPVVQNGFVVSEIIHLTKVVVLHIHLDGGIDVVCRIDSKLSNQKSSFKMGFLQGRVDLDETKAEQLLDELEESAL
jgi:hypothetical protein